MEISTVEGKSVFDKIITTQTYCTFVIKIGKHSEFELKLAFTDHKQPII